MLNEGSSMGWSSTQTDTQFPQHLEGLERKGGREGGKGGKEEEGREGERA